MIKEEFKYILAGMERINDKAGLLKFNFMHYAEVINGAEVHLEGYDVNMDSWFILEGKRFTFRDYAKLEKKVFAKIKNPPERLRIMMNRYQKIHAKVLKYGWDNLEEHHTPIDPMKEKSTTPQQ